MAEADEHVRPPVVVATPNGRVVHNPGAPERFLPRMGIPDKPSFLFSGVFAVAVDSNGRQAVLPPRADRVLVVDGTDVRRVRSAGVGQLDRAIAVTPGRDGWIVVERSGSIVSIPDGKGVPAAPTSNASSMPDFSDARPSFGLMTVARFGDRFIAARSAFASASSVEPAGAPLLLEMDAHGRALASIDTIRRRDDAMLTNLANGGHVAAGDSLVFFAYLTRDEIRAYDRSGHRRWTADRAMLWPHEPFRLGPGDADISFSPVNLSITVRGEIVYVLAYADGAMDEMRIDAFDAASGLLRRTVTLPATPMVISLDPRGALWYAPADTLETFAEPAKRPPVDFNLPTPDGDTLRLASYRGKIVLINIWASWCAPCRDEFPLLASLSRDFASEDFAVIGVSDDVNERAARAFLGEFKPPFAIAWGHGALEGQLAYHGLPFTVLLDRDGRELDRYIGFGGAGQFTKLRDDISRAIERR